MPKHDEDIGGTGEKNIGGQLGLVHIYSMQRPNKTHDNDLTAHTLCLTDERIK
jgi:hypothetical protein